jgi:hypothetical protein
MRSMWSRPRGSRSLEPCALEVLSMP